MKRIILPVAAILALSTSIALGQKTVADSARLAKLEQQFKDLQTSADSLHEQKLSESKAAKETYDVAKQYMESAEKLDIRFFNWMLIFLGIVTVFVAFGVFGSYTFIKVEVRRRLLASESKIKELLQAKDLDELLMRERPVLVVYKKGLTPQSYFTQVIEEFNHRATELSSLGELSSMPDVSLYAAVVIYNENDEVWATKDTWGTFTDPKHEEHQALIHFIDNSPRMTAIFYFGKALADVKVKNQYQRNLISYSNAPSQVFGNLLDLLKLREKLLEPNP